MAASMIPRRHKKPSAAASCKVKAIELCDFGTTRFWRTLWASTRCSLPNCAGSPPPKHSPIKGEGLTMLPPPRWGQSGEDEAHARGRDAPAGGELAAGAVA